MAKRSVVVSKDRLIRCINEVEQNGPLTNFSKLWEAVTTIYNTGLPEGLPEITTSVAGLRTKEFAIPTKTVAGKKGRAVGFSAGANRGPRVSRSDKFSKDPVKLKVLSNLVSRYKSAGNLHSLAIRVQQGSMSAALKLKCLDCCCEDRNSIKNCTVHSCPLWAFRPYQSSMEDETVEENVE